MSSDRNNKSTFVTINLLLGELFSSKIFPDIYTVLASQSLIVSILSTGTTKAINFFV